MTHLIAETQEEASDWDVKSIPDQTVQARLLSDDTQTINPNIE
jgi:hypothetical protein